MSRQRSISNMRASGGAEMLRLAAMRLCDADIVPIMLIHDGILLEETTRRQIEIAKEHATGRDTCNGLAIDVDVDRMPDAGDRYRDTLPQQMWVTMMDALQANAGHRPPTLSWRATPPVFIGSIAMTISVISTAGIVRRCHRLLLLLKVNPAGGSATDAEAEGRP